MDETGYDELMMSLDPQVSRAHYESLRYYDLPRWCSLWHQIREVGRFRPDSVLEVGGGLGLLKSVMGCFGVPVTVVDIAADLDPDLIGTVEELPVGDKTFDVACAFQVLEHLPFDRFIPGLRELARVSRKAVVVSLPDARPVFAYRIQLPRFGYWQFLLPRPFARADRAFFCAEHYWEVSRSGTSLDTVRHGFQEAGLSLTRTFRVFDYPYHRFFVADVA